MPKVCIAVHEGFGSRVGARRLTFDQIARNGERCAGETNQRNGKFTSEDAHSFKHIGRVGLGVERPQSFKIGGASEGLLNDWSNARGNIDAETDRRNGNDDVGIKNGGVDVVTPYWLHRDLGGKLWIGDCIEDAARAADGSIFGKRSAGLAHKPHRHSIARTAGYAAAGAQEGREGGGGCIGHGATLPTRPREGESGGLRSIGGGPLK